MKRNLRNSKIFNCLLLLLIVFVFISSGCGSNYEPDEVAFVLMIGIDKGVNNLLRVSYLIAIPSSIGGEAGSIEPEKVSFITTIEGPSLYASMSMTQVFVGRRISLMHLKGIIFSEEMAKDGTMAEFVSALPQFREMRGTAFLWVSKDNTEAVLNSIKPKLEANPANYIELLVNNSRYHGLVPNIKLQDFYYELKSPGISPVAGLIALSDEELPKEEGNGQPRREGAFIAGELEKKGGVNSQPLGAAVFRGKQMVGEIDGYGTAIYSLLRGTFYRGVFSMADPEQPDGTLSMEVFQARKPRIKVRINEEGVYIDAIISLEGNVLGNTSLINYAIPANREILEKAFEELMMSQAIKFINQTQTEFKADVAGFGTKARRLVLTEQQYLELRWDDIYPYAQVNVQVNYNIRRTGSFFRLEPIIEPS